MNESLVEISLLRREFREKVALRSVSLKIPRGGVYGLVGGNGAGKTTLIRHILGLFQPQFGTVRVFGLDPCAAPERVLAKIGYLSEDRDLPQWMRVDELVRYTRAFYPDWDPSYADELTTAFDLPTTQKVKSLSRGQLARLGLLLALAHRPELLVLDEPSSGLDPSCAGHSWSGDPHGGGRRSHGVVFVAPVGRGGASGGPGVHVARRAGRTGRHGREHQVDAQGGDDSLSREPRAGTDAGGVFSADRRRNGMEVPRPRGGERACRTCGGAVRQPGGRNRADARRRIRRTEWRKDVSAGPPSPIVLNFVPHPLRCRPVSLGRTSTGA